MLHEESANRKKHNIKEKSMKKITTSVSQIWKNL